uniref:C-type lectin domain-containing protein n=1 Tax=Branchiostoma floridae TaxID=7739 RepID=C3YYN0_BRAFL|eukprot:XP_002598658.1 hypothetical protein BRAFLDRAFT_67059 [Branchiostoma floridae]
MEIVEINDYSDGHMNDLPNNLRQISGQKKHGEQGIDIHVESTSPVAVCLNANAMYEHSSSLQPETQVSAARSRCQVGYRFIETTCIRFGLEELPYYEALLTCETEGATLAMPKTKELDVALRNLVLTERQNHSHWIGLRKKKGLRRPKYRWQWVDGFVLRNYKLSEESMPILRVWQDLNGGFLVLPLPDPARGDLTDSVCPSMSTVQVSNRSNRYTTAKKSGASSLTHRTPSLPERRLEPRAIGRRMGNRCWKHFIILQMPQSWWMLRGRLRLAPYHRPGLPHPGVMAYAYLEGEWQAVGWVREKSRSSVEAMARGSVEELQVSLDEAYIKRGYCVAKVNLTHC